MYAVELEGLHDKVTAFVPGVTCRLIGAPGPAFGVAEVVPTGPSVDDGPSNGVTLK